MNDPVIIALVIVNGAWHVKMGEETLPVTPAEIYFFEKLIGRLPRQSGQPVLLLINKEIEQLLLSQRPVLKVPLTDRELEVAKLLADGLASKEIGDRLKIKISPKTVDTHRIKIYKKLGINKISDLEPALRKYGLI